MKPIRPTTNRSPVQRLHHFTPLRYPGGKGKLAEFIKSVISTNSFEDGVYVEPYAGGAAIALELLFHEYVSHIYINDISRPVFAFWKCVLDDTDALINRIRSTKLTIRNWDKQKYIFRHADDYDDLELGFATFYLNRTNRSGILNAGVIGGRDQSGKWKIDARYNETELIYRIDSIARLRSRISLTSNDAISFLKSHKKLWPKKTLIYLDPPYYVKGKDLYYDYYTHEDHAAISKYITTHMKTNHWIVSYDDVPEIRIMYSKFNKISYGLGYSARESKQGSEVMFFNNHLRIPALAGSMRHHAA